MACGLEEGFIAGRETCATAGSNKENEKADRISSVFLLCSLGGGGVLPSCSFPMLFCRTVRERSETTCSHAPTEPPHPLPANDDTYMVRVCICVTGRRCVFLLSRRKRPRAACWACGGYTRDRGGWLSTPPSNLATEVGLAAWPGLRALRADLVVKSISGCRVEGEGRGGCCRQDCLCDRPRRLLSAGCAPPPPTLFLGRDISRLGL